MRSQLLLLTFVTLVAAPALAQRGDVLFDQSFAFNAGDRLEVSTSSPSVVIETRRGGEARVQVTGEGGRARDFFEHLRFTAERTGNRVVVRTQPRGNFRISGRSPSIQIVITIPERADVDVTTSSGSIRVANLQGNLRTSSSSGSVRLDNVSGNTVQSSASSGSIRAGAIEARESVTFNTSSGSVQLGSVRARSLSHESSSGSFRAERLDVGSFEGRTSSGSIRVDQFAGQADLRASSGSIRLGNASGAITANASSGSIEIGLRESARLSLRTSSGGVTVNAPQNLRANLDLEGRNFDIARAFSVQGEVGSRRVRGTINGGGEPIAIRTSSGRIRLQSR